MYERFTDRARSVMSLAEAESRRQKHGFIGTEHILIGLAKDRYNGQGGVATQVLAFLGATSETILCEVEMLIQRGKDSDARGTVVLSPRAKAVIDNAVKVAQQLNHNSVGTGHLLLALSHEHGTASALVLQNLGVMLEDLRTSVAEQLGVDPEELTALANEFVAESLSAQEHFRELLELDRQGRPVTDGGISPDSEEWETARDLAMRYSIPFVDLPSIAIPDEIIAMVPAAVAIEYQLVPLDKKDNTTRVIVSDPSIPDLRDRLRRVLGTDVNLSVAPRTWIESALQFYYGQQRPR
jgi:hypothetical protein